jgi:hypothetical protein
MIETPPPRMSLKKPCMIKAHFDLPEAKVDNPTLIA